MVLILSLSFGAHDFLHSSDKQKVKADWCNWKDCSVAIAWLQWWALCCTVLSCKEFQGATLHVSQHPWKVFFLVREVCIATIQCGVYWFCPVSVWLSHGHMSQILSKVVVADGGNPHKNILWIHLVKCIVCVHLCMEIFNTCFFCNEK